VLCEGGEYGAEGDVVAGSAEEMDFLGIPGLLDPGQVRDLLSTLRRELNGLVAAWHHRTGQPHAVTHAALRRVCGGPAASQASVEQISERINMLRSWAARPR
jgi:hypothetical protein